MFEQYTKDLAPLLIPRSEFHPFPVYEDREGWMVMGEEYREYLIAKGEEYLNYDWPSVPATVYMDFYRNGNRTRYERIIFQGRRLPLLYLTAAECCEGKGRFLNDIINGVWATMDESTWVIPAHNSFSIKDDLPRALPDTEDPHNVYIDLFAAECGAVMAWVYYLLERALAAVSPQITARMKGELGRRIFDPFLRHDAFWWMGMTDKKVNNWNPWILSNVMTAAAIACTDEKERTAIIEKSMKCLEYFILVYTPDGGCDEGPGYWDAAGASLFDCLEILYDVTNGKADLLQEELVRNICSYIYKMHIGGNYFVNYADAKTNVVPNPSIIYRMGLVMKDPHMVKMGVHLYNVQKARGIVWKMDGCGCMIYREMKKFFINKQLEAEPDTGYPLVRDVWFPGIQVMAARKADGMSEGLYLSAKGGNNDESHNHNDIGSFVIYCDSLPAIIDIGTGVYEKKTFSPQRYEIRQMQSNYHNLPIIGGYGQLPGAEYKADKVEYVCEDAKVAFGLDIQNAYPSQAGVEHWRRSFLYERAEDVVTIVDNFDLKEPQMVEWVFMTAQKPQVAEGQLRIPVGDAEGNAAGNAAEKVTVVLKYNASMSAEVELWDTEGDANLVPAWGECLYRTILRPAEAVADGEYTFVIQKESSL